MAKYKWESPQEWLMDVVWDWDATAVTKELMDLCCKLAPDTVQDHFQDLMDKDGFFNDISIAYTVRLELEVFDIDFTHEVTGPDEMEAQDACTEHVLSELKRIIDDQYGATTSLLLFPIHDSFSVHVLDDGERIAAGTLKTIKSGVLNNG